MSLALRFLLLPWSQNRPERWRLTGPEWQNVLWLRRCGRVIFLGVWKPNNELHCLCNGHCHAHVKSLSERKDLFPQLPGVLGGVSPGLAAFFDDCWDFKRTVSLQSLPCSQWLGNVGHTDSLSPALDNPEGPSSYRITLQGPLTPLLDLSIC